MSDVLTIEAIRKAKGMLDAQPVPVDHRLMAEWIGESLDRVQREAEGIRNHRDEIVPIESPAGLRALFGL